jgi:hypothetical protein
MMIPRLDPFPLTGQIDAMKIENKHIISLIKDLKVRDDFLGGKVEDFYNHLKILGQARLYDLCIDSPLTLGTLHSTIQAPTPSLIEASPSKVVGIPSAPNLIVSLLKRLGIDFPFVKNGLQFSKSSDGILTGSSQTLQLPTSHNTNQEGSPRMETERKELELHGEPLRMIQGMVFPLNQLWMGLETLMPVGLPKCFDKWKTSDSPLIRQWHYTVTWLDYYSSQECKLTYYEDIIMKSVLLNYVEVMFRLANYIRKHDLQPPSFTSQITFFEPKTLVPTINFYITQSLRFKNLMEILVWKPQGFFPGPELLETHDFFEPFHGPIKGMINFIF